MGASPRQDRRGSATESAAPPIPSRTRAAARTAACATLLFLSAGTRPAEAGGITVHLATAFEAWQHVTDPTLRNALQYEQQFNYGMGALYPDTVDFFMGANGHHVALLNTYAAQLKLRGCNTTAALSSDYQCQELVAHFMGCLAHVVADHRFDRYFLMKVDQECGFNDYGQADVGQSQHFTDFNIDAAISNKTVTGVGYYTGIQPIQAAVPGSYDGLFYSCSGDFPTCMNIENVMLQAYYPGNFPFPYIQGHVNTHHTAMLGIPALAIEQLAFINSLDDCKWVLDDVVDNYGGVADSGEVVARFIDKTWEILKSGGLPQFEQTSFWDKACQTISVYDATKSGSDRRYFDFLSWIEIADDVSEFRLGKLDGTPVIGWLDPDGEFSVLKGEWLDRGAEIEHPAAILPAPISAFQFSGDRIGVLVGSGPAEHGHELFVTENFGNDWVSVAKRVLEFQLEDVDPPRLGVLQKKSKKSSKRSVLVQEGPLDSKLIKVRKGSKHLTFQLDGDRIAVGEKKTIRVKAGSVKAKWVKQFKGKVIQDYRIEGERIAVLHDGELLIKEGGSPTSEFLSQGTGISRFVLHGPWVGAVDAEGLKAKSTLADAFVLEATDPSMFGLHSPESSDFNNYFVTVPTAPNLGPLRMGYLGSKGQTTYRDGLPEDGAVSSIQIHEDKSWPTTNHVPSRIGVLLGDVLYVKALCIGADPTP